MDLIKAQNLKNGLKLELFDGSKQIAADRWYLCLIARIDIPIEETLANDIEVDLSSRQVKKILGDSVMFEKKVERNFIDERKKDILMSQMVDSFLTTIAGYLASPNFAKKFVLKEYATRLEQRSWSINENS